MRSIRTALFTLLLTSLAAAAVEAAEHESSKGFTTTLNLGANFLVPPTKDKQAYKQLDPSFGFNLGLGYRFSSVVGLQLDYMFGLYDIPDPGPGASGFARFMALGLGPRFFIPAGPVEVFIDLGLGWDMLSIGASGSGVSMDSSVHGVDIALGAGAEYRIMPGLSAGLGLQYHLPLYFYACLKQTGESKQCDTDDVKLSRTPQALMLGATISVNWGKLLGGGVSSEPEMVPGGRSSLPGGGSSGAARPAAKPAPKSAPAAGTGRTGAGAKTAGGPAQRQLLPAAFVARPDEEAQVSLGYSQDDVVDVLGMPAKMDRVGAKTRFVYPGTTRGLEGFSQVVFLFDEDQALIQVEMAPERSIPKATIREQLGQPIQEQQTSKGVLVWIYKRQSLAFFFKPGTDQAYHIRHKAF